MQRQAFVFRIPLPTSVATCPYVYGSTWLAQTAGPISADSGDIGGDLHSFLQGLGSTAFCGADLRLLLLHQLRSTMFSPKTEINSVLRSRFSTPAISPTEVYTVFSQDTKAFAEQIFATPVLSPNEVITHFSQDIRKESCTPCRAFKLHEVFRICSNTTVYVGITIFALYFLSACCSS